MAPGRNSALSALPVLPGLHRLMRRHRRIIAACLAAATVLMTIAALRPVEPPMVAVLVAARELPPGIILTSADLSIREFPADYAAPGSLTSIDDGVGSLTSAPLAAGEPITRTRLVRSGIAFGAGERAVPVRIADEDVVGLIVPGQTIDLLRTARDGSVDVVAQAVRVITVPHGSPGSGLVGNAARAPGSLIIVAADPGTAGRLAVAAAESGLAAVIR